MTPGFSTCKQVHVEPQQFPLGSMFVLFQVSKSSSATKIVSICTNLHFSKCAGQTQVLMHEYTETFWRCRLDHNSTFIQS